MDTAYFSAFAALAGSAIGGFTSLGASWLTQHAQASAQQRAHDFARREDLYRDFIDEASKLYADGFEHDQADVSKLVRLYALISRMRVISSSSVVGAAENVASLVVNTYLGPNRTLREFPETLRSTALDPMREFSDVCREELQRLGAFNRR
jgi:hypothetical protein